MGGTQPHVAMRSSAATDSEGAPCAAPLAHALEPAPQQSCSVGATVRWAPLASLVRQAASGLAAPCHSCA